MLNGRVAPDTAADIFSLAMLAIYMLKGQDPMPRDQFPTSVSVANFTLSGKVCPTNIKHQSIKASSINQTHQTQRVEIPEACPAELVPVLQQCLEADPDARPTIEQVTNALRPLVDKLCADEAGGAAAATDDFGGYTDDVDMFGLGADLEI